MSELWPFFLLYAASVLLSCRHVYPTHTTMPKFSNVTDLSALLSLKTAISGDQVASLSSWNGSVHFCYWPGVTCAGRRHPQRVVFLELSSLNLDGSLPPVIAYLTFLRKLNLSNNKIHGPIPEEIGRLYRLRHLNLSLNSLEQGIPDSLSWCLNLQVLCLDNNLLRGKIPHLLTNLSSLSVLSMGNNQLSGGIPPMLGKISQLTKLDFSNNYLNGDLPISMWNLSRLSQLILANNNLSGSLASNLGHVLPLLERIDLYGNRFHGPIPISLPNASRLEIIDLSSNMFMGAIPPNFGSLQSLKWLSLVKNQLEVREPEGWRFLDSLSNCTSLVKLQLDFNRLSGILPVSIANFSTKLQILTMPGNEISGSLSPEIGNLVGLTALDMGQNLLSGSIPSSIGVLLNLHVLNLGSNKLSGEIPSSLGNLTRLDSLRLESNQLSGVVTANLGKCQSLILLDLSSNNLTGGIPPEIVNISTLSIYLDLSRNSLTGSIPAEVGNLVNLGEIDLSMNELSGKLPSRIGGCQVLEKLYLARNFLRGNLRSSLGDLRGMQELDISHNLFSGPIPDFFQEFPFLHHINLSFNDFEGEVPSHGVFANVNIASLLGNDKLCGGKPILHLPPCTFRSSKKKYVIAAIAATLSFISTFLCLLLFFHLTMKKIKKLVVRRTDTVDVITISDRGRISYAELEKATNGFSADNLIGMGSYGAVYKGITDARRKLGVSRFAVKVLNLQQRGASKSFMTECDVLKNIIHRNIVRIITTCSGIDPMGNDFKALVFEYMANGSLDSWLHPIASEQYEPKILNLIQRINMAVNVASALDYLHHGGSNSIIHCDIKPSNILLDDSLTAYVSDFGLARIGPVETLVRSSLRTAKTVGFMGTIGYVAPEYGTANRISTKGDVHSYGIVLLEMFTGKRPTDDTFRRDMSIKRYVERAVLDRVLDVIDANLLSAEAYYGIVDAETVNCISSLLRIGIICSSEFPANRPEMRDVVKRLQAIRDAYLINRPRRDAFAGSSSVTWVAT